jgi:hypothetical protein
MSVRGIVELQNVLFTLQPFNSHLLPSGSNCTILIFWTTTVKMPSTRHLIHVTGPVPIMTFTVPPAPYRWGDIIRRIRTICDSRRLRRRHMILQKDLTIRRLGNHILHINYWLNRKTLYQDLFTSFLNLF